MKSIFWDTMQYFSLKFCTPGHKTDCMGSLTQLPYCVTHLYDHKSLVRSENDNLFGSRSRFHWHVAPECGCVHSQSNWLNPGSRSWRRRPVWSQFSCLHLAKQWTYVGDVLEPVILQLCIVRPWTLVARMYHRLPLGNFQMQKTLRLQELEQVAKVRDYERCFSLDHWTKKKGKVIYGISTKTESRLDVILAYVVI